MAREGDMIQGDPAKLDWRGDRGFYPAQPNGVYDASYFAKYQAYARTELGIQLNAARAGLVRRHLAPELETSLIDVGIGSGSFVETLRCKGYDVNPVGVAWLQERSRFVDPYRLQSTPALSFWDSFEHIEHADRILWSSPALVFVALPIFRDRDHALASKHFRPDEHFWYFTQLGLVKFFALRGYQLVEMNDAETRLGREGIESFVFRRQ